MRPNAVGSCKSASERVSREVKKQRQKVVETLKLPAVCGMQRLQSLPQQRFGSHIDSSVAVETFAMLRAVRCVGECHVCACQQTSAKWSGHHHHPSSVNQASVTRLPSGAADVPYMLQKVQVHLICLKTACVRRPHHIREHLLQRPA